MTTTAAADADQRVVPEMEFCDRLARSMRLVHIGPGEVAHFLGVNPATVSRWLGGRTMPNRATVMILADMTGVDFDWLNEGRACRDSNPKPSVLELVHSAERESVRPVLTANRPILAHPAPVLRIVS